MWESCFCAFVIFAVATLALRMTIAIYINASIINVLFKNQLSSV